MSKLVRNVPFLTSLEMSPFLAFASNAWLFVEQVIESVKFLGYNPALKWP